MEQTRQPQQQAFTVFTPPKPAADVNVGGAIPRRVSNPVDEALVQIARQAIQDDPSLIEQPVHCTAADGVVTLSGNVAWFYQRAQCDLAVRYLRGVKRVVNKIEVIPAANAQEIQQRMKHAQLEQARTRALL